MVGVKNDGDTVDGGNGADVVGGGDGAGDRSLLLLSGVGDGLAGEVGSTTLGTASCQKRTRWERWIRAWTHVWRTMGDLASRAASRAATAVEEEVWEAGLLADLSTPLFSVSSGFCAGGEHDQTDVRGATETANSGLDGERQTYDVASGDGEALLLGVGEQLQDVVAVDDSGLQVKLLQQTHGGWRGIGIWMCVVLGYDEGVAAVATVRRPRDRKSSDVICRNWRREDSGKKFQIGGRGWVNYVWPAGSSNPPRAGFYAG